MKTKAKYALSCALLMTSTISIFANDEQTSPVSIDCSEVNSTLVESLKASPHKVLELVAEFVAQHESCAGEIVKIAIQTMVADKELVAQIVETAISAAPKQIGEVAMFAIATAPIANSEIMAVIRKYNAEHGTAQALGYDPSLVDPKSSDLTLIDPKAGIDAPAQSQGINPLDFPGGQTQFFVDPKSGAAAPGVGAPGTPVPLFVVNDNTAPPVTQ
ncbi:hypothetical protein ACFPK9_04500 [Rubritalea spongiae]|uniref:Uncharacterized protein n=1 Tax=Rubritalea spongiae TaxID=430797 RepID=A0ABW5E4W4_9BACT